MAIVVNCPSCRRALSVPETARGGQVRCTVCGGVFTVPVEATPTPGAGAQASSAQAGFSAPPGQPPGGAYGGGAPPYGYQPRYGDEIYSEGFNLQAVDPAELNYWKNWRPSSFSTAGAILLDIVTCGIFGLIFYGLKFGELPKTSRNDFGAGQGIGFCFIPYFNFYWLFRFWLGLCDRMNLQLRVRGMNHLLLPRNLAMTICILQLCGIVPYVGILAAVAATVCREIFIGKMQEAVNTISAQSMYPQM